jgi:hypothetical protein
LRNSSSPGNAQLAVAAAGAQHDGATDVAVLAARDFEPPARGSLDVRHFAGGLDLGPEALDLLLHLVDEARPVDPRDAGIVFDAIGVEDLAAGHHLLQDDRAKAIP